MINEMKTLGFLILLAVGSRASINKLFFLGPNLDIICPLDATFYQWKKYHNQKMTNIIQEDKRKLSISLKLEESPVNYECGATSGFDNRNVNITVYVLDRNSKRAQELCYLEKIEKQNRFKQRVQYPCFIQYQSDSVNRIAKGSSVTFDCEASGTNVTYMWYRLNTPTSHKQFLVKHNNSNVMEVVNANEKFVGHYLCVVNTTSGNSLQRVFELQLTDEIIPGNTLISIEGPETINITSKLHKNQNLDCRANVPNEEKVQAIQWGKKLDVIQTSADKNHLISWEGNSYKLLPESQITSKIESDSRILSSLLLKEMTVENTGEYLCVMVTNNGFVKYKTFFVSFTAASTEEEGQQSYFFLYILVPSLIIAVCLFIGIYLTINRRPARKPVNFATNQKPDNETSRLRTTPDYSSVQYQANPPPNIQYPSNNNYYNPYYPSSDKLIV